MPGARRHYPNYAAIQRVALGLASLTLLFACDSGAPPVPTPVASTATPAAIASTPTAFATATDVPEPSPTTTTAAPSAAPSAATEAWSQTIRWRDSDLYLLGVNYPYYHYGNDFGGNAWGNYGVHDPKSYADVDADFAKLASLGVRTVRWFAFTDGRAGITFDADGMPSGIDDYVFRDFDAALEIAERHNIAINFVLLDFRFVWDAHTENGVQLGGHSAVLSTPEGQKALVRNVFEPVFRRYAGHPAILSWEVMNEPEWTLVDAGTVDRKVITQPLTLATFRDFAELTISAIHDVAQTYATIGCADVKWAQNWMGLDLDYYQVHFYDWMQPYSTDNLMAMRAEWLRLDRPVVVGEFPADHSAVSGLRDYLNLWFTNGYAGAWPWSYRADTTWGTPDPEVLGSWAEAHKAALEFPPIP